MKIGKNLIHNRNVINHPGEMVRESPGRDGKQCYPGDYRVDY